MPLGRLTIARTASAMAAGLLSARAPLSEVMISPSADVRETTTGVPAGRRLQRGQPEGSCGPARARRRLRPAARRRCAGRRRSSGEIDRQSRGLPLQSGPPMGRRPRRRAGPRRRRRTAAAIASMLRSARFSTRQPATVHQQDLVGRGAAPPHQGGAPGRVEHLQVHAERDGDGGFVAPMPIEFFAGKPGGAHHRVVVGGSPPVGGNRRTSGPRDAEAPGPQGDPALIGRSSPWFALCSRPQRPSDLNVDRRGPPRCLVARLSATSAPVPAVRRGIRQ